VYGAVTDSTDSTPVNLDLLQILARSTAPFCSWRVVWFFLVFEEKLP
jgi:hypothetical protein